MSHPAGNPLRATIVILDADDVVLAVIAANLDQLHADMPMPLTIALQHDGLSG